MHLSSRLSQLLILLILFSSCQDILECVVNRRPELTDKILKTGQLGDYYYDEIRAEIKNEPLDDSYYYEFSVTGDLPEGVNSHIEYRKVILRGTPTESGNYNITLNLRVGQADNYEEDCESNFNDCDGLCSETAVKSYSLIIR